MYLVVFVLNQIKCTLLFKNKTVALCKVEGSKKKKGELQEAFPNPNSGFQRIKKLGSNVVQYLALN